MSEASNGRLEAIQFRVAGFSIAWLALSNLIGVWLAVGLIWPEIGSLLGNLGYGRWMPLHMDWQLYGWCALPSLGLIAVRIWKHEERAGELCGRAFWIWSFALIIGGVTWLAGEVVGKPFLNWSGFARIYFALSLVAVWVMVARSWTKRWKGFSRDKLNFLLDGILVAGLAGVPVALFIVSDATVYPPVNPHSGGATGHSLLLSTLGIVALMGFLPSLALGIKRSANSSKTSLYVYGACFLGSIVVYLLIQHGHVSNREFDQVFGLGTLMIWPALVAWLWKGYHWKSESRIWRGMFLFWWTALAVSGWLIFLPEILETIKFTNGMVAHAHLAMAGMVTALNMVILIELGKSKGVISALSGRGGALLWNAALMVFVVAMSIQGYREGQNPGALFLFDGATALYYVLRLGAGVVMFGCSLYWVRKLLIQRG